MYSYYLVPPAQPAARAPAFIVLPTGGTVYNLSVSEAAGATDTVTDTLVATESITEAASATDTVTDTLVAVDSISESASASDAPDSNIVAVDSITEAASASDTVTDTLVAVDSIAEAAAATDAPAASLVAVDSVSEAASATDAPDSNIVAVDSISETAVATDAPGAALVASCTITDAVSAADTVTTSVILAASIAEPATAADAPDSNIVATVTLTESGSASDTVGDTVIFGVGITDTANATDFETSGSIYPESIAEAASAADTVDATIVAAAGSLLLTLTDHGDGTGATATITGADTGATTTVWVMPPMLPQGSTWYSAGTLLGDGTIQLPLAPNFYFAYASGTVRGVAADSAVINLTAVTAGQRSVESQLLDMAEAQIRSLAATIAGYPQNIYSEMVVNTNPKKFPAVLITCEAAPIVLGTTTNMDDWGKPVVISICDINAQEYTKKKDRYLYWRQVTERQFHGKRPPGVPEGYVCVVEPRNFFDPRLPAYDFMVSAFVLRVKTREPRTP